MNADLELTLKHLKALVACDTSNPPRNIEQSGLISYLCSLDFIDPQVSDLGEGSFNIFLAKGSPNRDPSLLRLLPAVDAPLLLVGH